MNWTQDVPSKPGYYLEYTRFNNDLELCELIQVFKESYSGKMKVNISHFGNGYRRSILLETYAKEHQNGTTSVFAEVEPPK